ncbi:MAG: hypothetical protein JOZ42_11320 [Acetobacteraceae bacterium]|nr:hypothetical protein [Acetobacteraceae bacterium]
MVVQYADPAAYEKAQTDFARDSEYRNVIIQISRITQRISRELVDDLDL